MQKTLLLDNSYRPVDIITWQKAIVLLVQEKAETIEDSSKWVSSVSRKFAIPKILRLIHSHYSRARASFSKRNVFLRDRGTCAYCGVVFQPRNLTIDHVVPKCQGGGNDWKNVITINARKASSFRARM